MYVYANKIFVNKLDEIIIKIKTLQFFYTFLTFSGVSC